MNYTVEVVEEPEHFMRPFIVKVNGEILMTKRQHKRRYTSSIDAAIAGAKHADALRYAAQKLPGAQP